MKWSCVVINICYLILYSFCPYSRALDLGVEPIRYVDVDIVQLTFSPKNHELDNNDNFSYDDRFICYDTRGTYGSGIENCITIEVVDLFTGKEYVVYRPPELRIGVKPAPGVGAVSFHPNFYKVVFIHGPEVEDISSTPIAPGSIYSKTNRRGLMVDFEFSWGNLIRKACNWVDFRFVDCAVGIPHGAHRGGSHRHEFSLSGKRIGCTYDDFILPAYGRTIAFLEPVENLPFDSKYHFSVILRPVLLEKAKLGDLTRAFGDSWVDMEGSLRGFIGSVKVDCACEDFLFVARIPGDIDLNSGSSGNCNNYPTPPDGIEIRCLFEKWSSGIVRGSPDGKKIAFLAKDSKGRTQVFIVDLTNMDKSNGMYNVLQLTDFEKGVEDNIRWHPSGKLIFSISDGTILATSTEDGDNFGRSVALTPSYRKNKPYAMVVSRNGKYLAYNRRVPTFSDDGDRVFDSAGMNFSQIFLIPLPENLF